MALDPDFAALAGQAPAPAPASPGAGLDDDFKALLSASDENAPPAPGIGEQTLNAGVRAVGKALFSFPTTVMDAGLQARNFIEHPHVPTLQELNPFSAQGQSTGPYPSQAGVFNQWLDKLAAPPTTPVGQGMESVNSALAGSLLPMPQVPKAPGTPLAAAMRPSNELSPTQQSSIRAGQDLGMQVTPGQLSGSTPMLQAEEWARSHPWTSGPFAKIGANNQSVLNQSAAASIGEKGTTVDADTLARASERLGGVFQSVRNPSIRVPIDPATTGALINGVDEESSGLLANGVKISDNPLVQQVQALANAGSANGQQIGQLSSKLGKAAFKQMASPNGDRDVGLGLYKIKDHVDDLLQSALSPDQAEQYAAARGQYRNLMTLTSRTSILNPATGNVSGVALANRLQQSDKNGYLYGGNQTPLYQAARFSQAVKPIVGNSGTATRESGLGGLGSWPASIPTNLAARLYLSRMGSPLARGAIGLMGIPGAVGRVGQRLAATPALPIGLLDSPSQQ